MKITTVQFVVLTDPAGKGRPKFARRGKHVVAYTPAKTLSKEQEIAEAAKIAMNGKSILEGELDCEITFYMPVPKSYPKKISTLLKDSRLPHSKKPDLDNLAKLVLDAMNGIVYKDDAQIWSLRLRKFYSNNPNIVVGITSYNEKEM